MKLSVADIRIVLEDFASSPENFISDLNKVVARYYDEGVFKSLARKIVYDNGTSTGIINLPRRCEALLGISCENGNPLPVYGQFHEWKELSIGYVEPDEMSMVGVIDMGPGFPTTVDIATEGTIRIQILSSSDANKKVRLFGTGIVNGTAKSRVFDSSGNDGLLLTTANPTADTTQTFDTLTDVQLPSNMVGRMRIYVVNSGTATLLSEYEPGEIRPSYRRYKTGVTQNDAIIAFCKLKFVPYRSDNDMVDLAHLGALQYGFQALTKEIASDFEEAATIWALGVQLLQKQLKSFRGAAKPRFPFLGKENLSAPSIVS